MNGLDGVPLIEAHSSSRESSRRNTVAPGESPVKPEVVFLSLFSWGFAATALIDRELVDPGLKLAI